MASQVRSIDTQIETAARQALAAFLTPGKKSLSEAEQAILARATLLEIPFESVNIQAFYWGEGPIVMLVHGWGSYGLQLSGFIEPLVSAGYRVLTFDAPAHGSTAGVQTSGIEMAKAIATVARTQPAIAGIIAHSLGAPSMTLALSEGTHVAKVVYIGAICWLSNAATTFSRRARLSPAVEAAFRSLFEVQFGSDLWDRFAIERTAQNLSIPALLIHDTRDRDVSIAESQAIAKFWAGARLVETTGLGHRRILRDESVIQQTVDFLTDR